MTKSDSLSVLNWSLLVSILGIFFWGVLYYPKWKQSATEATISHDVSGYYLYLPATLIYKDLKKVEFLDDVLQKYKPSPHPSQVLEHKASGNKVMKYSMGQALHFLPGFIVGHIIAELHPAYEADGFSKPYQYAIGISMFFYCLIGIYILSKILTEYFSPFASSVALVSIVLASNYLEYGGITNAMTHNTLFTNYCLLIYFTIKYYNSQKLKYATLIGIILGLNILTRPTEIIGILIPILWGVNPIKGKSFSDRISFLIEQKKAVLLAGLTTISIGSLQIIYWYFVSGDWIVYSYADQGFSWLRPHVFSALTSYKTGWLIYSPVMVLAILGFLFLPMKDGIWFSIVLFCGLFTYIVCAWDLWWYGGSLGQRAMVQSYPLFAFAIAAFAEYLFKYKILFKVLTLYILICIVYNFWWTHQAHKGGILKPGIMTKEYFWANFLVSDQDNETLKLLDTDEIYNGGRKNIERVYPTVLDVLHEDTTMLGPDVEFSQAITIQPNEDSDWLRIWADIELQEKEWDQWAMTQLVGKFYLEEKEIKTRFIRIQRLMEPNSKKKIFFDLKVPPSFDDFKFYFWNPNDKRIWISNMSVEKFNST